MIKKQTMRSWAPRSLITAASGAAMLFAILAQPVSAAVGITPASGGGAISADTAATGGSGAWTSLGAITIAEGLNTDFAVSQTGATLVLTAPAGFEFNTAQVPDVTGASTDLSGLSMAVPTATSLQLTFTTDGVADAVDSVVIGGVTPIQVRPTNGTIANGNIVRTAGNPGTATIAGVTNDVTNFGSLGMVVGTVAQLGVTTQPATATAGAVFGQQPAVRTEDQFGNASTTGLAANLNVTAAINAGTGPLQGTTALDIGTLGGNGTVTYTDLRMDVAQAGATLDFSAAGLTTATSGGFAVGHAAATKLALTTPPSASSVTGVAFAQQPVVTVQDAFNNTVTSDNSTVITAALTTGTGTLSGTATETAASGIANFAGNGLAIDLVGNDKVLTFTGGVLTPAVSGAFTIALPTPSAATSTLTADPAIIVANGKQMSTITVQLKDAGGTDITFGGDTVVLATGLGTLSAVVDNGDGTYSATLRGTTDGTAVVSGTLNSNPIVDTASVVLEPAPVTPVASEPGGIEVVLSGVTTSPASPTADVAISWTATNGSTATATVPAAALPAGATVEVGAVSSVGGLAVQATPPVGTSLVLGFSIRAADADGQPIVGDFESPVALEFNVDASVLPANAGSGQLRIAVWNGSAWVPMTSTVVVNADGSATVSTATSHFSLYAVIHDPAGFGRLVGSLPAQGVGLATYRGGLEEFQDGLLAAGCTNPAFVTHEGEFIGFLPNAPFAAINADFLALFAEGIPLGQPMLVSNCS